MSLKDRFDKFIDYFTEDGDETELQEQTVSRPAAPAKQKPELFSQSQSEREQASSFVWATAPSHSLNLSHNRNLRQRIVNRLHARQQ